MKKCFYTTAFAFCLAFAMVSTVAAQTVTPGTTVETQKRAQTGFKFLSSSVDARASAIGGAVTAEMMGSSTSLFYNPASMAGMQGSFHLGLSQLQHIVDINYNVASAAFRPQGGNYGVFGLSLVAVDYGEFIGTIRANNDQGFLETGTYSPSALAVGFGYARSFTDRFSAGVHVKYALQDLGTGFATAADNLPGSFGDVTATEDYSLNTIAFDFGVVYATGFRSLVIAMSARNFSRELTYVRENFELPLTFQIGAQMNMLDFTSLNPDMHTLNLHVDAQRPRDFEEHIRWGLEYTFMDLVSLRGGFEQMGLDEEQGVSLGAGVNLEVSGFRVGADYTYTDFGIFDSLNRVSIQIGL